MENMESMIANNEVHYMTKIYSSQDNEGPNSLSALYEEYKGVQGNAMFKTELPYTSIEVGGQKFITQYDSKHDVEGATHSPFYIQSNDGQPVQIAKLAELMGTDIEGVQKEIKN